MNLNLPTEPGAQLAQLSLAFAKNLGAIGGDIPSKALFYLADAIVRIANGCADPRQVIELTIELLTAAVPGPAAPPSIAVGPT